MFTGLVEEVGRVTQASRRGGALRLTIAAEHVVQDLEVDDSIAVNGVCLTAVEVKGSSFLVEAVEETLRKTTLASLRTGSRVNLERSLTLADRLGGHFVQGHVDGVGRVTSLQKQKGGVLLNVRLPSYLMKYVISEGSIAIDGVSLTVARLAGDEITISLIPHTLELTTLGEVHPGQAVNIEVDVIGKYVESILTKSDAGKLTEAWMQRLGYD
ncbi:MAG: riboflavin synthase [Calditrichaeota bacterium]|nr:MAG: riboflavin synthase [Calditrichota bacterium]